MTVTLFTDKAKNRVYLKFVVILHAINAYPLKRQGPHEIFIQKGVPF